jgi:hypothetical protein
MISFFLILIRLVYDLFQHHNRSFQFHNTLIELVQFGLIIRNIYNIDQDWYNRCLI